MKFEIVSKYTNAGLSLPERKTAASAGYDFQVAEDTVIPSLSNLYDKMALYADVSHMKTLKELTEITKATAAKPTLVPTGIKCEMPKDMYLELSVRSSCPLKHWLILANGVGIIDADYYNNPDNEGHIFFQIINLSPFDIVLKKGDTIGQGIFKKYYLTDDDAATAERQGGFGSTDDAIIDALVNAGLPQIITSKEYQYVVDKFLSCDVYNNGEKINTINFSEDECTMACNPERRAFIAGQPKNTINTEMASHYE